MQAEPPRSVITIEPFDPSDFPLVYSWCTKFWDSVCDDDIPGDEVNFVNFKMMQGSINLAVYRDDQLGGMLSCGPVNSWVTQAHCIFRKEAWGSEFTIPALQLGIDFAFEKLGYKKIISMVYEHNARMRALLEKLGAKQEGFHVAQTRQNGKPVNMVSYGIFKGE